MSKASFGGGIAKTFKKGQYQTLKLSKNLKVFRAEGGQAKKFGRFFGTVEAKTAKHADNLYNISVHGNTMEKMSTYIIPKGTVVNMGKVKGGSGTQIFINNPVKVGVKLLNTKLLR